MGDPRRGRWVPIDQVPQLTSGLGNLTRFLLEEARGGMEDPRRGRWVPLISAAFHLADIEPRPAVAIVTQGLAEELVS